MNRRLYFILLISCILCSTMLLSSCNRNEDNPTSVSADSTSLEEITTEPSGKDVISELEKLGIQITVNATLQEDKEAYASLIEKLNSDLTKLAEAAIPLNTQKLIIEDTLFKNKMAETATGLTCTDEQIRDGEYLEIFLRKCVDRGVKDSWKTYAIVAMLSEENLSEDTVKTVLQDADRVDVLSMFPAYFSTYYQTDTEIAENAMVAKAYGKYIADTYGLDKLLTCKPSQYLEDWLQVLKLDVTYEDPFEETLDSFEYTEIDGYAFAVETDQNLKFLLTQPKKDYSGVFVLRLFLSEQYDAVTSIMKYLETEAPDYYPTVLQYSSETVTRVYFDVDSEYRWGFNDKNEIHLASYDTFSHEFVHVIVHDRRGAVTQSWRYEGLCNRLSMSLDHMYTRVFAYTNYLEYYLSQNREDCAKSEQAYDLYYYDCFYYYHQQYGLNHPNEELDVWKLATIKAQLELLLGEQYGTAISIKEAYDLTGGNAFCEGDDVLSYTTAPFFADFLIRKYSLSTYLEFCYEKMDFADAFGTSFDEEYEAWKNEFLDEDIIEYAKGLTFE